MGNDLRKAGVRPGVNIDMNLFERLWETADRNHTGHLSRSEGLKFLDSFSSAVKSPYNTSIGESLLEFCGGGPRGRNGLNKEMFAFLLTKELEHGNFSLSNAVQVMGAQASAAKYTEDGLHHLSPLLTDLRSASGHTLDIAWEFDKVAQEWTNAGNTAQAEQATKLADFNRDISQRLNTHIIELQETAAAFAQRPGMSTVPGARQQTGVAAGQQLPAAVAAMEKPAEPLAHRMPPSTAATMQKPVPQASSAEKPGVSHDVAGTAEKKKKKHKQPPAVSAASDKPAERVAAELWQGSTPVKEKQPPSEGFKPTPPTGEKPAERAAEMPVNKTGQA